MKAIGLISVALFTVGWAGSVAAWFYVAYHLLLWMFKARDPEHKRKFLKGAALFVACWLLAMSNGLIGTWLGGWATMGR